MLRCSCLATGLWALLIGWAPAFQAPTDKNERGQDLLSALADYPKPFREAILEIAQYPTLLAKLEKRGVDDPLAPLLAGQPKDVQQAAQTLAKHPEVLKILQEQAAATAELGKAFAANKDKGRALLDREAELTSQATDAWAKRLGQDADAIEQLPQAIKAYQKNVAKTLSVEDAANEAGVNLDANNINVTALPTPGFSEFVMNNADGYPALANTMVSQWLGTRNSRAYDHTFSNWWNRYQDHFHDEHFFRADEHRADRLGDLARYDRKFAKDDHRWDKFNEHRKDFPHAGKVPAAPKDHKLEPGKKPHISGGTEHKPVHKPIPGKHAAVRRGHPSEHHQIQHAAHGHRRAGGGHRR